MRPRFLGERDEPLGMSSPQLVFVARLLEALDCVFADRLEHPVSGLAVCGPLAQEALVKERLQSVGVGSRDLFRGLVSAAADEDREPREEPLLVLRQEAVTPLNGRPQRLLAGICIAIALQQVEPLRQSLEQLLGREDRRTGGGEFDGQRELVQTGAELVHCRRRGEAGIDGARSNQKEGLTVILCECRDRPGLLPTDAQTLAARDQQT